MPHVNERNGEIVVRIVYDGAPEAGKTTNVRVLSERLALQRRGRLLTPGQAGRRTEFFDWLDFQGGYVDGRRLSCQLLSVPGQNELIGRRRHLLESADAVVFVADARPGHDAEARAALNTLQRIRARRAQDGLAVGLLLQANKQDLSGASPPAELAEQLGIAADVPCFGAVAEQGRGVTETFMTAVRLAVERVRAWALEGAAARATAELLDPEALLHALQRIEVQDPAEAPRTTTTARTTTGTTGPPVDAKAQAPADATAPTTGCAPGLTASSAPHEALCAPDATSVPSGCAWPPVRGRSILYAARAATHDPAAAPAPWRPPGALELRDRRGWLLHTCPAWHFTDLSSGRDALRAQVRQQLALGIRAPRERALLLAPQSDGFRIWAVTQQAHCLGPRIAEALRGKDTNDLRQSVLDFVRAMACLSRDPLATELPVALTLEALCFQEGRLRVLALPCGDAPERTTADLWRELDALLVAGLRPGQARALRTALEASTSDVRSVPERQVLERTLHALHDVEAGGIPG